MDVKSAFLNGYITEEIYVAQPLDFENHEFPNYVAARSCCAQMIWIKQQMEDYDLYFDHIPINCDNKSAINLSKNPIQH